MPKDKIEQYTGLMGIIMGLIFRSIFYVVVLLIFIGDILLGIARIFRKSIMGIFLGIRGVFVLLFKGIGLLNASIEKLFENTVDGVVRLAHRVKKAIAFKPHKKHAVKKLPMISIPEKIKLHKEPKLPSSSWSKLRFFGFGVLTALLIITAERGYSFVTSLPDPKLIGNVNFPVSTQIYDRNGILLYDVFRDQDRTPVSVDELPEHVIQATLSIEDRNFYNHNGISLIGGILRAVKDTYKTGDLQGGSTITQQLVKTSLLTPERTFERKVKEAILALWTERIFTKQEILQMYLNQVAYGGTAYGIEEAAKTFFNKPASQLTLNDAAFLAGLTRAPSSYSPYVNPQISVQRRNEVLQSMKEAGYISNEQLQEELQKPLNIEPLKTFIRAPHFVFYVKSLLEQKYGIRRVEEGGLRVVTTLDINVQEEVEDILQEELAKVENLNITNGAVTVTSPSTGEILAMVGSKSYFEEPYGAFNVTTARRQPGSSIKPIMYALALESGKFTAASIIKDEPVVYQIAGSRPYSPVNYDSRYHGNVPLRYALANSYNIPAVKALNEVGVPEFIKHAEKMGITTWDTPERYGLSLALGGAEVKMLDMAVAFGVFANYGNRVDINPILSVEDFRGDILEEFEPIVTPNVLSAETSFIMSDILSDNFARRFAFGSESDLVIPGRKVAAKTGTTNSKRDNWTNGYTRKYFVGVWVGNNDNTPMNPVLTSGVTGASPIWNRVMTRVLDMNINVTADVQPPSEFNIPPGVVSKRCYFGKIEYFKAGTESTACSGSIFNVTPSPGSNSITLPLQD